MKNPILSFTSHKARLPHIDEVFRSHVANAETCGMHVCLALQEDSVPAMTPYQRSLVDGGKIELLTVEKDHGSNTKWTLCRAKYPDATMVVVDDDILNGSDGISRLLEKSRLLPSAVICRCVRFIPLGKDRQPLEFNTERPWAYTKIVAGGTYGDTTRDLFCRSVIELEPGEAFPEHAHGCVYPPGFPSGQIIEACRYDDDVMIGALAAREGVELVFAGDCGDNKDRAIGLPGLWERQTSPGLTGPRRTSIAVRAAWNLFAEAEKHVLPPIASRSEMWQPFGPAFLLHDGARPERFIPVMSELSRVGLTPFVTVLVDDHTVDARLTKRTGRGWSRAGLAHLLALERFLASYESPFCVIVEDDVRFVQHLELLRAALASAPSGFGALRMDWGPRFDFRSRVHRAMPAGQEAEVRLGNMWVPYPDGSGDGCTVVSRECAMLWAQILRGMRAGTSMCDGSDNALCDACRAAGKPLYVSNPPLCVQPGVKRNFRPRGCLLQASSAWYNDSP